MLEDLIDGIGGGGHVVIVINAGDGGGCIVDEVGCGGGQAAHQQDPKLLCQAVLPATVNYS